MLPHLDYANAVWGDQPGLKSEMEKLQSFQNKFARKMKLGKMSSLEALKYLNWLPLAGRRLLTDVPQYKMQSKETFWKF